MLDEATQGLIRVDGEEIVGFRFVPVPQRHQVTVARLAGRVRVGVEAVSAGVVTYLENGARLQD